MVEMKMKKKKLLGSKIAVILGILILLSSASEYRGGGISSNFLTGNMMIFGSLAYMARRKLYNLPSIKWRVTEIISIIVLYLTSLGILSGGWYTKPIPFFVAPIWIIIAYVVAFREGRENTQNTKSKT